MIARQAKLDRPAKATAESANDAGFAALLLQQGLALAEQMHVLERSNGHTSSNRVLRYFSLAEAATYLGISTSNLKKLHLQGKGPQPVVLPNGRRLYSAQVIADMRTYLAENGRAEAKRYLPGRALSKRPDIITVCNPKAGTGKTMIAAHLAQYLALTGYKVLAIDLDPQGALTRLFGIAPENDGNTTLMDLLNPGKERPEAIGQETGFPNLRIIPGNQSLQEYSLMDLATIEELDARAENLLVDRAAHFDVILFDCPATLIWPVQTAFNLSTGIIIPAKPTHDGFKTLSHFMILASKHVGSRMKNNNAWIKVALNFFDPRNIDHLRIQGALRSIAAERITDISIPRMAQIEVANKFDMTLYELQTDGQPRNALPSALEALEALNNEIRGLLSPDDNP